MILASRTDGPADAAPLVLLNSVGSTSAMWTPVLGPLVEQFRVVRIDHRGHGASDPAPAIESIALDDLGADLVETLDAAGLQRVDIAGVSLGGMLAMWLAIHHPARVGRLGLFFTSAHMDSGADYVARAATVRSQGMGAVAGGVASRWITPGLAERDPAVLQHLQAMIESIDPENYAQCCTAIGTMDLRADLARIAAPTLVLAGAQDPATPVGHARVIAEGIAGARLEVLDDAAHVATVEQPGAVAALMLDHFRGGATVRAGFAVRRAVLGDRWVDAALADPTPQTAAFQQFLTRYAWGEAWTRPGLARRDRSIATVAALITLGAEHELAGHVRAARRNGLTDDEIGELVLHLAIYAGMPRANRAMAIVRDVLAEPRDTAPTDSTEGSPR